MIGNVALERAAIEMTYEGKCDITEYRKIKEPVTGATRMDNVPVVSRQPCALSQSSLATTTQTDSVNVVNYDAKLFLSPDIVVKAGSRIRVIQDGMDYTFDQAGEPFRYPTHQEIMLKRVKQA